MPTVYKEEFVRTWPASSPSVTWSTNPPDMAPYPEHEDDVASVFVEDDGWLVVDRGFRRVPRVSSELYHIAVRPFIAMDGNVPHVTKVIDNDPATVVLWSDGTKTVAKAHGGDEYDKRVGLLSCCLRKALMNRRYDRYEHLVNAIAKTLGDPMVMRCFAAALMKMAEAVELEERG